MARVILGASPRFALRRHAAAKRRFFPNRAGTTAMNARISCRVLALLPLLVGLGCSGGGKPVKVEGVATLDGKPLPAAMIQFIPDGGGVPANGVTGTDGTFRLTTYSSSDGAMPGTYKVLVSLAASDQ